MEKGTRWPIGPRLERRSILVPWSGCRIWLGAVNKVSGYGLIGTGRKLISTHRAAWEEAYGTIPDGLCVLHRCDIRCCINPSHLFLGGHLENSHDAIAKGRAATGEKHGNCKLSDAEVTSIRFDTRPSRITAADYGIDPAYVRALRRGDWRKDAK